MLSQKSLLKFVLNLIHIFMKAILFKKKHDSPFISSVCDKFVFAGRSSRIIKFDNGTRDQIHQN